MQTYYRHSHPEVFFLALLTLLQVIFEIHCKQEKLCPAQRWGTAVPPGGRGLWIQPRTSVLCSDKSTHLKLNGTDVRADGSYPAKEVVRLVDKRPRCSLGPT